MMGLFSDELNKMLLPELKKHSHVYTGILTGLARELYDITELSNIAGITTTSFNNYIPFLTDTLDLVKKEISVTEKSNSKLSRYIIKDPFIYFWYRYIERNKTLLEMGQTDQVQKKVETDLPNLEGRILEMIFRERILENSPIEFDIAGSVFKNRKQIEVDFLLASQKQNKIHAYEIKRGGVNKKKELNKLIHNVSQLEFKSIRLNQPEITGQILTVNDLTH
jgi:AAA+ ATPase superfamily predicted ATPase